MIEYKFIGIENELISFNKKTKKIIGNFYPYFKRIIQKNSHLTSTAAIRTKTGNGYYVDGEEIEILTPPIALNHGFASRLTKSLIIGRNHVIKNTPELLHTGYSMHWNLSRDYSESSSETLRTYEEIWPIMFVMGLNPLSVGTNLRLKGKRNSRYEILAESLRNPAQINALALLLGSYSFAKEKEGFPIIPAKYNPKEIGDRITNFIESRKTPLRVFIQGGNVKKITFQDYLEIFYKWVSPYIKELGTHKEISNLEKFISGKNPLEIDMGKYYKKLLSRGIYECKTLSPYTIRINGKTESTVLKALKTPRTPIEGTLLGKIAQDPSTIEMSWERIETTDEVIRGIEEIYEYADQKYGLNRYQKPLDLSKIKPEKIRW